MQPDPGNIHATNRTPDPTPMRSTMRCLAVWITATAALIGLATLSAASLRGPAATLTRHWTRTSESGSATDALLLIAGAAGLAACALLWCTVTGVCWASLRGCPVRTDGHVRRLTLLACGVVVTVAHASPALAGDLSGLDGLPHPERPTVGSVVVDPRGQVDLRVGSAPTSSRTAPADVDGPRHRVAPGDSLWSITERHLAVDRAVETHDHGSAAARTTSVRRQPLDVAAHVRALHRANREVLGADPDLIHPGQVLDLNSLTDPPQETP